MKSSEYFKLIAPPNSFLDLMESYIIDTHKGIGYGQRISRFYFLKVPKAPVIKENENGDLDIINGTITSPSRVKYIKNSMNGSTANSFNHWVEFQVINKDNVNIIYNKPNLITMYLNGNEVQSNNELLHPPNKSLVVDNNINTASYFDLTPSDQKPAMGGIVITLPEVTEVDRIKMWHYYSDSRTYKENKVEVSEDGKTWDTIFDSSVGFGDNVEYAETRAGKEVYLRKAIEFEKNPVGRLNPTLDLTFNRLWVCGDGCPLNFSFIFDDNIPHPELYKILENVDGQLHSYCILMDERKKRELVGLKIFANGKLNRIGGIIF